ncbi:MAG: glycoside hydrolase family 92 protein [Verrucomicrobia bacterium]|nr:MAG: glycoside hydrolase family 92 protein [Verrucomicrobiota bacterium]
MTSPIHGNPVRETPPGKRRWRSLARIAVLAGFWALVAVAAAAGMVAWKYRSIVGAGPGRLETAAQPGELGRWMDPFIGTGGFPWMCGNNFPGAMAPFGMVRLGPETTSLLLHRRALNTSGYYYGDERTIGFSHTRLNGTGATDGGHFLVMPSLAPAPGAAAARDAGERFSHRDEKAFPGYYAVRLPGPGILAELTATRRVGVHRYTFGTGPSPHILLDVANALGGHRSRAGHVRVLPGAREIEGTIQTFGTFAGRHGGVTVHCVARCNRPFAGFATWDAAGLVSGRAEADGDAVGADLSFAPGSGPQAVELKVAISCVGIANARANLEAEPGDFDAALAGTRREWEGRLGSVRVEGGSETERRIFYTALGRVFQMPTLFSDADGRYVGLDHKVHVAEGFSYYTDLSLWDTFRTVHPLLCIVAPDEQRDICRSLVRMSEDGGWLPRWPSGDGYSNSMLGTPADVMLADSYLRGIRDFDAETAYRAMLRTATNSTPPGSAFSGRSGVLDYIRHGYCPTERVDHSVARTLEYAWEDHAIGLLAEALGHRDDAARFKERGQSYRKLWNPETRYFQPRDAGGKFSRPFDPHKLTYFDSKGVYTKDYVEGSALQWRWCVPHDGAGLVSLFPSREAFASELDDFFRHANAGVGEWHPGSHYWHGNQPDIHAAYLFNDAGRPDLTRKWARWILRTKYGTGHAGLDGNDDGGTLSAWYVFGALGLYPVAGSDRYELGLPLFARAEVRMKGAPLVIVADNVSAGSTEVRRVSFNGVPLERHWIRHAEIEGGGILRFEMEGPSASP